ncbi:hypothetical protein UO65_3530 [Actinokineospora spheciospongiae]|uniref:Uncharacterized protein n=1 Tax=Actinokineospora spheciospongiae TaxID=909613 RepID=W7J4Y0_9PSEU|nr:hypothetical protein UO65_3530 [Actinokineospora spheciospongiae]
MRFRGHDCLRVRCGSARPDSGARQFPTRSGHASGVHTAWPREYLGSNGSGQSYSD